MSLKERFAGGEALIEALLDQKIVRGDRSVAEALASSGELIEFAEGQQIIRQGDHERAAYFILSGRGQVIINGYRLYTREAGSSVGEMSAINHRLRRSATIEAMEDTVAWRVTSEELEVVGKANPQVWRQLAIDLAGRLEQRNALLNRVNIKPNVFIISSAESLPHARAIRVGLEHVAEVEIWSDEEIFRPGAYPLEDLERKVAETDFGIALAHPDDLVKSRGETSPTPRDNVLFELGFFMSRLGRHRTLLVVPRSEALKLPSDFKGLTPISYLRGTNPSKDLGPAIDRIINVIGSIGVRASLIEPK